MSTQVQSSDAKALQPLSPFRDFWRHFSQNRGAVVGLAIILALVFVAVFAELVAPFDPTEQFRDALLKPPVWEDGSDPRFLLGTDPAGRDILSRLIHGARLSMLIGVIVVTLSLSIGVTLGLVAGSLRGKTDFLIMRTMDVILAVPSLLLALVIIAMLEKSLVNGMIAISVTIIPSYARLTRAAVMAEMSKDYVTASRVAGAGFLRLLFKTVLPNCLAPLIVQATLSFSGAILDAAALGFLGLGAQPPTPEWGTMLSDTLQYIRRAPWVVTTPGLMILVTVLAFNLMGDGLRDALDPKLKRS